MSTKPPPLSIATRELTVSVGAGKAKKLGLNGCSASFAGATLSAVMGPSGAGKSTLLSAIRGVGKITGGDVLVNGRRPPSNWGLLIGIIPQDDILYQALTPRETLAYVARLRLGDQVSTKDKIAKAEAMIARLGLGGCADTRVGGVDLRGISGGERKRTSIGCELIANPRVLLVDEPTSGLDSKAAFDIIQQLRDLAHDDGVTVICTVHQPSWKIFTQYDSLTLLRLGQVCYDGPILPTEGSGAYSEGLVSYFGSLGHTTGAGENPIDFFFEVLQSAEHGEAIAAKWSGPSVEVKVLGDGDMDSSVRYVESSAAHVSASTSTLNQFAVLTSRCFVDYLKDPTKWLPAMGIKVVIGILLGILWFDQASEHTQKSIFVSEGPLFFCVFSATFDTMMNLIIKFPQVQALVQREVRNGYYTTGPYFMAEFATQGFFASLSAFLLGTPCYFLVGLGGVNEPRQFFQFIGVLVIMSNIGIALGMGVGSLARDIQEAQGYIMPLIMPMMLFAGFMIPYQNIPSYFMWLYDLSFLQYALSALYINQFADVQFSDCASIKENVAAIFATSGKMCPMTCFVDGTEYLASKNTSADELTEKYTYLIAFLVSIVTISYGVLSRAVWKKVRSS